MQSDTLLAVKRKEKRPPKFHVYYDEWSGNILSITRAQKPEISQPFIVTEDPVAGELLMGKLNPKKYTVAELADGPALIPKQDASTIRKEEYRLSLIPRIPINSEADINIVLYVEDWVMEVNISEDTMYNLTGSRFARKFSDSENTKLSFYFIAENNPFRLLDTVEVDLLELFNNGYILLDLSELKTVIGLGEVRVLTKRMFKNYGLKVKQNYVNIDHRSRKSLKRYSVKLRPPSYQKSTLFTIQKTNTGWNIKSNFDNPEEHRIYKDLKIFITGEEPTELLQTITVPYGYIGKEQIYFFETTLNPKQCKFLMGEDGRNLSFKIEENNYGK